MTIQCESCSKVIEGPNYCNHCGTKITNTIKTVEFRLFEKQTLLAFFKINNNVMCARYVPDTKDLREIIANWTILEEPRYGEVYGLK